MTITQTLTARRLEAIKNKKNSTSIIDEYSILSTLYGSVIAVGKDKGNRETTDEEAMGIIQKFANNVQDTINFLSEGDERIVKLQAEKDLYMSFLPSQLSTAEINTILSNIEIDKADKKAKGEIMKYFVLNHKGAYNGKELTALVDTFLKS
jgi:uncharacterized protein YqeY